MALVERDGNVHSFPVERVTSANIEPIVKELVAEGTHVITDISTALKFPGSEYRHDTVNDNEKEYSRKAADGVTITTNTVEGYFAILKRGNYGIYHHWGKHYTDQYLREFDFRYNVRKMNDDDRSDLALKKTEGKRLMLKSQKGP